MTLTIKKKNNIYLFIHNILKYYIKEKKHDFKLLFESLNLSIRLMSNSNRHGNRLEALADDITSIFYIHIRIPKCNRKMEIA